MLRRCPYFLILVFIIASCGRTTRVSHRSQTPFVKEIKNSEPTTRAPESPAEQRGLDAADQSTEKAGATSASAVINGQIILQKTALFGRTFLYGFDLQYSSAQDAEYELIPQSESVGHYPAQFRLINSELQLVADQRRLYESDINHPELLFATWTVVQETTDTITVAFGSSGLAINEAYNGKGIAAPKASWVRSLRFETQGEYILQESAMLLADGNVQTYFESIFPRDNIVPQNYQGYDLDASFNPDSVRYRFLSNENIYADRTISGETVRLPTSFANRYNLAGDGTIDWYVTANIPDRFLPAIKSGTEGWNRYFRAQLGRDVVRFMGRLPAGVAIGDPRYNVINWDSVADAGAAYESSSADTQTGIQSHSLIYLPLAWYNIGIDFWSRRTNIEQPNARQLRSIVAPKSPDVLSRGAKQPIACVLSAEEMGLPISLLLAETQAGGRSALVGLDEFGMRLLAAVLFHEVGHGLGLHHNFKGSLSYDGMQPMSPQNPTTWSAMDYNYYQNELDLFTQVGTSDGPALEYDRQIISTLYNEGRDVVATDPVLPACNDDESDNVIGGVDPLCGRYDSEKNPIDGLEHARNNLFEKTGAAGNEAQTLAEVVESVTLNGIAGFADPAVTAVTLKEKAETLASSIAKLVQYYIASGAQSLRVNLRNNSKALRVWMPDVPVDELAYRGRYDRILREAMATRNLPANPAAALRALTQAVEAAVVANPAAGTLDTDRALLAAEVTKLILDRANSAANSAWSRVRQGYYGEVSFTHDSPFAIALASGNILSGFEDYAARSLGAGVLMELDSESAAIPALSGEREVAANQLLTFKGVSPAFEQTILQLGALVLKGQTEGNQNLVDEGRRLLQILR